jgi:isochorismate pyruvate lyase
VPSLAQDADLSRPQAVEDTARVEQIVAKRRSLAEENHVSPGVIEVTYRAMIAAFTEEERKLVEKSSQPLQ